MNFKRFVAAVCAAAALLCQNVFFVSAEEIGATRGEVVEMLLNAADDYNPEVKKTDVIKGYEDGLLHEERGVTRAEALVMLKRAFGTLPKPVGHNARMALAADSFNDIPDWAQKELAGVFDAGIAAGTAPGTFSPDEPVTKEQMNLFIDRVFALFGTNEKDDFYAAVNKETLETMEIPALQKKTDSFTAVQNKVDGELLENVSWGTSNFSQKFYQSLMNKEFRDKNGIKPVEKYMTAIQKAKDFSELLSAHYDIQKNLFTSPLIGFTLARDFKDNTIYRTTLVTYEPLMPADFYINGTDEQKEMYFDYLRKVSEIAGDTLDEKQMQAFFDFEKDLVEHSMDAEQAENIENLNNLLTPDELAQIFSEVDIHKILSSSMLSEKDEYLVMDVAYAKAFAAYMTEEHTSLLKNVMQISLLNSFSGFLGTDLQDAVLTLASGYTGMPKPTDEQLALETVKSWMPADLSSNWWWYSFEEPKEIKAQVTKMVYEIIDGYRNQVDSIDWASDKTKVMIHNKLNTLEIRVGSPEAGSPSNREPWDFIYPWGTYGGIRVSTEDAFLTLNRILGFYANSMKRAQNDTYNKELDDGFVLDLFEANAGYIPQNNRIELPFALLQKPFYDANAPYEENLAGIGFIIAHEIAHAFDTTGVQFDSKGNAVSWMTKEESDAFAARCTKLVSFYDNFEAAPGILTDGRFTLKENLADQMAMQCLTKLGSENKKVDMQEFYRAFARIWASTSTRDYAAYIAKNDTHAPDKARVNRTLENCDGFYEAFGITEKDGMWVDEENRVSIW